MMRCLPGWQVLNIQAKLVHVALHLMWPAPLKLGCAVQGGGAPRDALVQDVDYERVAAADAILQQIARKPGL